MSNAGRRNRMVLPGCVSYSIEHIVFAVDTSGSISTKELNSYVSTINSIIRFENPERITLIQCDARVQDVRELHGEIPTVNVKGRGGTAFQPVFDYLAKNAITPTLTVYLTDGYGDQPRDPGHHVVWVSTGSQTFPFGTVIPINVH
jgi:predicted metal-dependent peptidase